MPASAAAMAALPLAGLLHVAATLFMAGLIWFVQLVHYPLFLRIPESHFASYHEAHMRRTGRVVVPLMLGELATASALLVAPVPPLGAIAVWGFILLALIWLSTFLVQVPQHRRLAAEADGREPDIRALVRANWFRTALWSLRSVGALVLLVRGAA